MKKFAIAIFIVFISIILVDAQDIADECDFTNYLEAHASILEAIESGDTETILEAMQILERVSINTRASCTGFAFNSDGEGMQPVLGPIEFPDGTWIVTLTTDGYFIGRVEPLSGECDAGFGSMYNIGSGDAADGAQRILQTEACVALIAIENTTEDWGLTIVPVGN